MHSYDLFLVYPSTLPFAQRGEQAGHELSPWRSCLPTPASALSRDRARRRHSSRDRGGKTQPSWCDGEWGYSFWDGLNVGSRSIMFHGYTPVREPGLASFWRFEFDWQLDECLLRDFLVEVFGLTLCVTGYGGYTFVGLPSGEGAAESWDVIYAWARRYWGINVEDVDVSAAALLDGMKCVSWLTAIGPGLCLEHPHAVKAGRAAASWSAQTTSGTILQVGETPVLGDRNRQDDLSQYEAMANALLPLQVQQHGSFGEEYDCKWDERRP